VTQLDGAVLQRFLQLAGERLRGDWVVIGGCVLPIRGIDHRVTVDIDIAGPDTAGMDQTLALLGIAEDLGLPVEAINQAGTLFLRRIQDWEQNLTEVHRGSSAVIHVPDATLFLLLKVKRLTESDLGDCLALLKLTRQCREPFDSERVDRAIRSSTRVEATPGRWQRLETLRAAVNGSVA